MPIFGYNCNDCGEKFELLVGVTSEKTELKCTSCGSGSIEKTFEPFSVGKGSSNSSGPHCNAEACPVKSCPGEICPRYS